MKMQIKLGLAAMTGCLFAFGANADPVSLSQAQMDSVAAGGVEKVDGFVCPVITTENVLHAKNGAPIGEGHYTVGGPDVSIPLHATNADGAGTPPGPHSQPGDTDYTAIWARQP
jgi:hypothetical protein